MTRVLPIVTMLGAPSRGKIDRIAFHFQIFAGNPADKRLEGIVRVALYHDRRRAIGKGQPASGRKGRSDLLKHLNDHWIDPAGVVCAHLEIDFNVASPLRRFRSCPSGRTDPPREEYAGRCECAVRCAVLRRAIRVHQVWEAAAVIMLMMIEHRRRCRRLDFAVDLVVAALRMRLIQVQVVAQIRVDSFPTWTSTCGGSAVLPMSCSIPATPRLTMSLARLHGSFLRCSIR